MKSTTLLFTLLFSFVSFAQNGEESDTSLPQNEFRINMSNLIAFKWVDISYERILNEESAIGVGTLFTLDSDSEGLEEYRTFSITPYYRHFFSIKYAKGFFVEAFGMLHTSKGEDEYLFDAPTREGENHTNFAVGISAGGKFVTKRGFVAEIYLGIGRDLLKDSTNEVVGRGGISIGYRF